MIEWNNIKNGVDNLLGISNENPNFDVDYLTVLFEKLEKHRLEYETVSFTIMEIKEKGFKIKTGGLYGYISFYHMPWKYSTSESWRIVYPYIKEKVFYAKVFESQKNEHFISIKLNGKILQFKNPDLVIDDKYKGIITKKTNYGVFIDLGYHFDWACGSIVGMVHKSQFTDTAVFDDFEEGQIIEVFYWGINEEDQIIIGIAQELKDWITGEIKELIGDIVNVKVNVTDDEKIINFVVENMYKGLLPVKKSVYPNMSRTQIKYAISTLENEEIIQCKIIGINEKRKALDLKWIIEQETNSANPQKLPQERSIKKLKSHYIQQEKIEDKMNPEIVDKLKLIGETVNVEVLKVGEGLQNKYIIEGKYKGKLSITNDNYRISVIEKQNIEKNLQAGDILRCEIISVEKKSIRIKWRIGDEELLRFINFND